MSAADMSCSSRQPLAALHREVAGIFQLELRGLPRCLFKICQKKSVCNNPAGVPPKPPAHRLSRGYQEASMLPELSCASLAVLGKGQD